MILISASFSVLCIIQLMMPYGTVLSEGINAGDGTVYDGSGADSYGLTNDDSSEISFIVLGDNLIHESIYNYGLKNGDSFDYLFENVNEDIAESDIAIINQETPLIDDPALYSGYPVFGSPLGIGQAVVDAGFDVVTLATNHSLDKGSRGIEITKNFFVQNGILCLGSQTRAETSYKPYEIIQKNGLRIAMLNYTYGTNGISTPKGYPYMVHRLNSESQIRQDIALARQEADIVIVFPHWGTEYTFSPDSFQQRWTRIFLECGVDIVIGAHPHVIQPYGMLTSADGHEMLVYYSLGNFVSAQADPAKNSGGAAIFDIAITESAWEIKDYGFRQLFINLSADGAYMPTWLDSIGTPVATESDYDVTTESESNHVATQS